MALALTVFTLAGQQFAALTTQVRRLSTREAVEDEEEILLDGGAWIGRASSGEQAIVTITSRGRAVLLVDHIDGLLEADVVMLPALLAEFGASQALMGAVLSDDSVILVVDLRQIAEHLITHSPSFG